ncbi:pseudaminic acid cytidylyltransferase [Neolewinella maritima]|uniref:pseudaminic acid cytidylyltransferase n=1 Tax=Neolewinella maritima TaxID=1383882 RepID=UPI001EE7C46F|nr:pseudaminic acid cytidylyltransferase [Neolewinella maritima]
MGNLAIIPARGGSKRIPRKNIRPFLGKPILAYSIEAALQSGLFEEVIVSTDDVEIGRIGASYGAQVPFYRSAANSDDTATTFDALSEVLEHYATQGRSFDNVCCIYPTSPFVTADLLQSGLSLLEHGSFDCVFPVLRYSFPIQRAVTLDSSARMKLCSPEHLSSRSQDLVPSYHDAGMFYWFQPEPILRKQKLWTDNTGCIEVSELAAQDIDTLADWQLAEFKYKYLQHG